MPKQYFIQLLVFCIALSFTSIVNAQATANDSAFLSAFFQFQNNSQPEFYFKEVEPRIVGNVRTALASRDTLFQWNMRDRNPELPMADSFFFTAEERKRIDQELWLQQQGVYWPDQLASNTKSILYDTVSHIFNDHQKGWMYFHKYYGRGFYSLIKPIFLRDANYCLFYYEYLCGYRCGEGVLAMYKKEQGSWKHYITIYNWIS